MIPRPHLSQGPSRPGGRTATQCPGQGVRALVGLVFSALAMLPLSTAIAQARGPGAAGGSTAGPAGKPAGAPPEDLRPALDKPVWYAPHSGCLDRLWVAGGDRSWVRRYPERSERLSFSRAEREGGRWWYRFTWADGSAGRVLAPAVVDDLRFEALPTTFYQTCFFLQPPEDLAGYLRAQQPLAMQRYAAPGARERAREIVRIEQSDRRPSNQGAGRKAP